MFLHVNSKKEGKYVYLTQEDLNAVTELVFDGGEEDILNLL